MMELIRSLLSRSLYASCAQCGRGMEKAAMVRKGVAYCCSREHAEENWAGGWI